MERRNLDFEVPLTREQWEQLGQSANFRPDFGVMRWAPAEFDVIRVSVREDDAPEGWGDAAPPADDRVAPTDREVARFVYNDGRPFAQVEPPANVPAARPEDRRKLQVHLERWVRAKWHELMRDAGIHYDRGALPADEPNPPR
ncbi:MAG: hypothetical protein ACJ79S_12980 [Gemmatimonadaceae bacterium]